MQVNEQSLRNDDGKDGTRWLAASRRSRRNGCCGFSSYKHRRHIPRVACKAGTPSLTAAARVRAEHENCHVRCRPLISQKLNSNRPPATILPAVDLVAQTLPSLRICTFDGVNTIAALLARFISRVIEEGATGGQPHRRCLSNSPTRSRFLSLRPIFEFLLGPIQDQLRRFFGNIPVRKVPAPLKPMNFGLRKHRKCSACLLWKADLVVSPPTNDNRVCRSG